MNERVPDTELANAIRKLQAEIDEKYFILKTLREQYHGNETIKHSDYINSVAWQETRQKIFRRDGFRCVMCGQSMNLNVHHITYENLGAEESSDLVTLCQKCHEKVHREKKPVRPLIQNTIKICGVENKKNRKEESTPIPSIFESMPASEVIKTAKMLLDPSFGSPLPEPERITVELPEPEQKKGHNRSVRLGGVPDGFTNDEWLLLIVASNLGDTYTELEEEWKMEPMLFETAYAKKQISLHNKGAYMEDGLDDKIWEIRENPDDLIVSYFLLLYKVEVSKIQKMRKIIVESKKKKTKEDAKLLENLRNFEIQLREKVQSL